MPVLCFLATALAGCVSTSQHAMVKEEIGKCSSRLAGTEERLDKAIEISSRLTRQAEELRAQSDDYSERLKECEFVIREREDEFSEEAMETATLRKELEARREELKPLLEKASLDRALEQAAQRMASDLIIVFQAQMKKGLVKVETRGTVLLLTINNNLLYKPSSAVLTASGKALLGKAVESLSRVGVFSLRLESYTDNIAPGKSMKKLYPSNWELSAARAAAAASYLTDARGIAADIVVASGHAHTFPIADNSTREGRAANRRLVLAAVSLAPEASLRDVDIFTAVTKGLGGF